MWHSLGIPYNFFISMTVDLIAGETPTVKQITFYLSSMKICEYGQIGTVKALSWAPFICRSLSHIFAENIYIFSNLHAPVPQIVVCYCFFSDWGK